MVEQVGVEGRADALLAVHVDGATVGGHAVAGRIEEEEDLAGDDGETEPTLVCVAWGRALGGSSASHVTWLNRAQKSCSPCVVGKLVDLNIVAGRELESGIYPVQTLRLISPQVCPASRLQYTRCITQVTLRRGLRHSLATSA